MLAPPPPGKSCIIIIIVLCSFSPEHLVAVGVYINQSFYRVLRRYYLAEVPAPDIHLVTNRCPKKYTCLFRNCNAKRRESKGSCESRSALGLAASARSFLPSGLALNLRDDVAVKMQDERECNGI